jgi:hypothetical protein
MGLLANYKARGGNDPVVESAIDVFFNDNVKSLRAVGERTIILEGWPSADRKCCVIRLPRTKTGWRCYQQHNAPGYHKLLPDKICLALTKIGSTFLQLYTVLASDKLLKSKQQDPESNVDRAKLFVAQYQNILWCEYQERRYSAWLPLASAKEYFEIATEAKNWQIAEIVSVVAAVLVRCGGGLSQEQFFMQCGPVATQMVATQTAADLLARSLMEKQAKGILAKLLEEERGSHLSARQTHNDQELVLEI